MGVTASLINRNKEQKKHRGHMLETNLWSNGKFLLPNGTDAITYLVAGEYNRYHSDNFQRFALNFGQDPKPADYSDRYFRGHPEYYYCVHGAAGYIVALRAGFQRAITPREERVIHPPFPNIPTPYLT